MEYKTEEALYLLKLIAAALDGGSVDTPFAGFDWDNLYALSVRHKVEGMTYIGLCQTPGLPESVMTRFVEAYKKAVVTEYIQHSEGVKLLRMMERNGIDCLPLKGWVIKPLYPQPVMRSMCDIDILIKKSQAQQVRGLMMSMGYDTAEFGGNPDVYRKKPIMNVEIHNALIRDKTDHFDTSWDRAVAADGLAHTYRMTDEDYYLFLSAHLRKHFYGGGTGVRSVADVRVFLKSRGDRLDWGYIEDRLSKSGLWAFDEKIRALCRCWFDGAEKTDALAELEKKILFSAAYGTDEAAAHNTVVAEVKGTAGGSAFTKKLRYLLRLMFPGVAVLSESYPFVGRHPFLLPAAWIARGFSGLFLRRGKVKKALSDVIEINNDELGDTKKQ